MPKSLPRRNAAKAVNGRFRQVFAWKPALFAKSYIQNPRNGCRRAAATRSPCPAASKNLGDGRPGDDGADRGHGHPGKPGSLRERLKAILRDRAQNLVVVAAGNDGLDADDAAGEQFRSGRRQRDARRVDHGGDAGRRAQLGEIAGQTIRHIHRRAGVIANRLRQRLARLRHAIAPDQHLLCRGIVGEAAATAPP